MIDLLMTSWFSLRHQHKKDELSRFVSANLTGIVTFLCEKVGICDISELFAFSVTHTLVLRKKIKLYSQNINDCSYVQLAKVVVRI